MITSHVLLNRSLTPRTLFCRRRQQLLTSFFLLSFNISVSSVFVFPACFAFVPFHIVDNAGSPFAAVAPKFGGLRKMHLAGFTALEVAPSEARLCFLPCSVVKFHVAGGLVSASKGVGCGWRRGLGTV